MRLGILILPEHRWSKAKGLWQRAEELGFAHGWTYDHLAWRGLRDSPWFGAVPTLTAAALATAKIRLGTLVASANFRHPVPFAKELMTLDDISEGRLTLGIGAGGQGWDATMLGQDPWPWRERADRFAEFVDLTDRLLRQSATTFHGSFYSAEEARTLPGCVQQPRIPMAIAATGPRGMRLAAGYGQTWVTTGERRSDGLLDADTGSRVVKDQMALLDAACREIGRDPLSIDRLVLTGPTLDPGLSSVDAFVETAGRYAEIGVTDLVVHWPRTNDPYVADQRIFEQAATTWAEHTPT